MLLVGQRLRRLNSSWIILSAVENLRWIRSRFKNRPRFYHLSDFCEGLKFVKVRRYTSEPGQSTSYKVGLDYINQCKKKRMEKLKGNPLVLVNLICLSLFLYTLFFTDKFNLLQFHLQVLNCLGPLDFLEDCVEMEERLWAQNNTNLSNEAMFAKNKKWKAFYNFVAQKLSNCF